MADRRHAHIVNLSEIEGRTRKTGKRFGGTMKMVGASSGARGVGCTWYEIEPGRSAFPTHFHCANEEAIFVLEGEGMLRLGDERVPVRALDWITMPTGPKFAHQLTNTGSTPLRYLCMSTMTNAEVVGYPDSKKVAALAAESYPSAMKGEHWVRFIAREGTSLDYFDGEDVDG